MEETTVTWYPEENSTDYYNEYGDYSLLSEDEDIPAEHLNSVHMVSIVLHSIAFLVGVPGNAIVIWVTGFRMERTVNTVWFLNLAIADLIFVLFLPFYITYTAMGFHWPFGQAICKLNSSIAHQNLYASVTFLMVISLDRYIHLAHPCFSQKYRTVKNGRILCLVVWVMSVALSIPNFYFRDTPLHLGKIVCYNNFHEDNLQIRVRLHIILVSVRFVIGYLLPLVTIIISYTLLVIQVKRLAILTSSNLFRTVTAVVVAFFVCWTPYHIFCMVEIGAHHNSSIGKLLSIAIPLSSSLAFINSCLNPILYVFIGKNFRLSIRKSVAEIMKRSLWEVSRSGTVSESVRSMGMDLETLRETTS